MPTHLVHRTLYIPYRSAQGSRCNAGKSISPGRASHLYHFRRRTFSKSRPSCLYAKACSPRGSKRIHIRTRLNASNCAPAPSEEAVAKRREIHGALPRGTNTSTTRKPLQHYEHDRRYVYPFRLSTAGETKSLKHRRRCQSPDEHLKR